MSLRNWIIITALGTIWGASFYFNEILIREITPFWVSAGRVGMGALASWVFVIIWRKKVPQFSMIYLHFFLLGTLSYAIPFALFPLSQQSLPSGAAAILNAFTPLMTVIVSHFWPNSEKATWTKVFGVIAGLVGVTILASPALREGGATEIWAVGFCLFATFCYAFSLNYTRYFDHVEPTVLGACALSGAAISATIVAITFDGTPSALSVGGWGAMLGIGLLATAIAFQVMYRLIPIVGGTNFSVVTFIAPISAIILGALFLDEALQVEHFLGMAAIFLGLLLIDGRLTRMLTKKGAKNAGHEA